MNAVAKAMKAALDCRELVISELADSEARLRDELSRMTERAQTVEAVAASYRDTSHVAIGMLARTTYQRDKAYAALYRQRDRIRAQGHTVA